MSSVELVQQPQESTHPLHPHTVAELLIVDSPVMIRVDVPQDRVRVHLPPLGGEGVAELLLGDEAAVVLVVKAEGTEEQLVLVQTKLVDLYM